MDVTPRVLRLSGPGAAGLGLMMIILGVLGGFIAQQLRPPVTSLQTPLTPRLISNLQPQKNAASNAWAAYVEDAQRSIVVLAAVSNQEPIGTALVITNDGLLVSAGNLPAGPLVAVNQHGESTPVTIAGRDVLYGLTYLRLGAGVVVAAEVATTDAPVGSQLLTISRALPSSSAYAQALLLNQYQLPAPGSPAGIQRWLVGNLQPNNLVLPGSPLLNEEGKVAGLLIDPTGGLALPATNLDRSIDRFLSGRGEVDPVAAWGIDIYYTFVSQSAGQRFVAQITGVKIPSPAAAAGLKIGDMIVSIKNQPLQWEASVATALGEAEPLAITVLRAGQEHTVTLSTSP